MLAVSELAGDDPSIRYVDRHHAVPDGTAFIVCGNRIPDHLWKGNRIIWIVPPNDPAREFVGEQAKSQQCLVAVRNPDAVGFNCAVIRTIRNLDVLWVEGQYPFESNSNSRVAHRFLINPPLENDGLPEIDACVSLSTIEGLIRTSGLQTITGFDLVRTT